MIVPHSLHFMVDNTSSWNDGLKIFRFFLSDCVYSSLSWWALRIIVLRNSALWRNLQLLLWHHWSSLWAISQHVALPTIVKTSSRLKCTRNITVSSSTIAAQVALIEDQFLIFILLVRSKGASSFLYRPTAMALVKLRG